jgi:hypothetical protein
MELDSQFRIGKRQQLKRFISAPLLFYSSASTLLPGEAKSNINIVRYFLHLDFLIIHLSLTPLIIFQTWEQ